MKMEKKWFIVIVVIGIVLVCAIVWYPKNTPKKYSGQPESITIGSLPLELSALIYIADDQHFFADNGLNISIKYYDSGVSSVDALIANEVDMATASEFVFAEYALNNEKISVLGCIDTYESHYLIARKDKGITTISNLKGKKIGVPYNTVAEFYLGRYLSLHGITFNEVNLVNLKPQQLNDSISKGDIDAVAIWQPYADTIKTNLGENAAIWPEQSGQLAYFIIISKNDWIANHPALTERFFHALAQAQEYSASHPSEAKAIVEKRLQYDPALLEKIWPQNYFALSFDQALIIAMEDESRWVMTNNLTTNRVMPNYLDYINTTGLSTVKPESVNIIR